MMRLKKKKQQVFLFMTHEVNDAILDRFYALEKSAKKMGDVYMLIHKEKDDVDKTIPRHLKSYIFNLESIRNLGYKAIAESIVPGSAHFALLQFYKDYPNYEYYWSIEYDVVFTGKWTCFFKLFKHIEADLLASHIKKYAEIPWWNWWNTLNFKNDLIKEEQYIRSFNPIYRMSNRALQLVNLLLVQGNSGHYEAFIPTVLNFYNYKIIDFGGDGAFVLQGYKDKSYIQKNIDLKNGTMRFRPAFEEHELILSNKLYHPIKPF